MKKPQTPKELKQMSDELTEKIAPLLAQYDVSVVYTALAINISFFEQVKHVPREAWDRTFGHTRNFVKPQRN